MPYVTIGFGVQNVFLEYNRTFDAWFSEMDDVKIATVLEVAGYGKEVFWLGAASGEVDVIRASLEDTSKHL